jgi:hypothetical protein
MQDQILEMFCGSNVKMGSIWWDFYGRSFNKLTNVLKNQLLKCKYKIIWVRDVGDINNLWTFFNAKCLCSLTFWKYWIKATNKYLSGLCQKEIEYLHDAFPYKIAKHSTINIFYSKLPMSHTYFGEKPYCIRRANSNFYLYIDYGFKIMNAKNC